MSLTAEETAVVVGQLQWSSAAVAAAVSVGDDPRLAAVVALLGQQETRWANHLPESVLLRPAVRVAPASAQTREAITDLAAVPQEHLVAVAARLIRQLERELDVLASRIGSVADAALGRAIATSRTELRHASTRLDAGLALESTSASIAELLTKIENGRFLILADNAEG